MMPRFLPLLAAALLATSAVATAALPEAKVTRTDDRVRIELGGQLFTEYLFKGGPRPYFYPVLAADGTRLNRDFPMKADTPAAPGPPVRAISVKAPARGALVMKRLVPLST